MAEQDPPIPFAPGGLDYEPGEPGGDPIFLSDVALRRQQVRLQSMIVLLLMGGLALALPFILSQCRVVVQPPVTALILSIVLSPLADRLTRIGLPNMQIHRRVSTGV